MKTLLIIINLFVYTSLFANINRQSVDDSLQTYIAHLEIGDSVTYKTYLTSCLSGDRYSTMDSVCFYRDTIQLKAIYKNVLHLIEDKNVYELSKIEHKLLTIGATGSTSYYNYIIHYKGEQGLLGFGEKDSWNELIRFITEK